MTSSTMLPKVRMRIKPETADVHCPGPHPATRPSTLNVLLCSSQRRLSVDSRDSLETPGKSRRVVDEARRAARLMNDNLAAVHQFELSKVKSNAAEASAKMQDELKAEKARMMVNAAAHTTPCS